MKGTWDSDRDPLAALRRGEPALFEEFVRTEIGTFLGFFQRLGAERTQAEDLTQEVFLKLYRSAPSYQVQSRFSSYALRVARNAWIDHRRRRAVRPELAAFGESSDTELHGESLLARLPAPGRAGAAAAMQAEERRRIEAAVRALPQAHALVFELAVIQELPYAEIAALLDIPVGTVKSRVFNALRKLREQLGAGGSVS